MKRYEGLLGMAGQDAVDYAKRLDRVEWTVTADGKDLVTTLDLYVDPKGGGGEAADDDDDDDDGGSDKAKGTEAIDMLDKISKGAAMYYSTPHVDASGSMINCQFPASVECTPSGTGCGKDGDRFPADPSAWDSPTWASLMFAPSDAHYFQYCFESDGELNHATFTVTARADLDCDGTITVYKRSGKGDPEGTTRECIPQLGELEQSTE